VSNHEPLIKTDRLDAVTEANAALARESFPVFRRTIRPGMLWGPFVAQLTRELQKFLRGAKEGQFGPFASDQRLMCQS
jgi:hypothetical protein